MNTKILLAIAVIAMGLVILPTTLSLFAGQHNWYETNTQTGAGVPCQKCHADVYTEIMSSNTTANLAHRSLSPDGGCTACHITSPVTDGGLVRGPSGNTSNGFHAAAVPMCTDCHKANSDGQDATQITYQNEAHRTFASGASNSSLMRGMNEACIACHTHTQVNITWTKPTTLQFTASSTSGSWIVSNMVATGSYTVSTSGN